jgi:hypothetical protein
VNLMAWLTGISGKLFLDRPLVRFVALAVVAVAANMVLLLLWLRRIRKEQIQVATAAAEPVVVSTANRRSLNKAASAVGMGFLPPISLSGLSNASDTQVKDCALALVARIREELWELDREDSRLFAQQREEASSAVTQGQKQNIWDQYVSQRSHDYAAFLEAFPQRYHVEANSLRDEMLRRLPVVEGSVYKTYESPIDTLGVEEAVRELERLAKLL